MKKIIKKILRVCCTYIATKQAGRICVRGGVKVNFPSKFTKSTYIGDNCHFNGIKISGSGKVVFGNNFHSGKKVRIITSYHNYDNGTKIPYDDSWVTKDVIIGDNVWCGEDVLILAGVTIGEGAVIQAGSVVCKDIPALGIAGGHPAVVV